MLSRFKRLPSPALVIAVIALSVAIGGVAVALPGHNSVRSDDIKNGQVKSPDLQNNGVKGKDVLESSLGTVPNANHANSADTADTAGNTFGAFVNSLGVLQQKTDPGITSAKVGTGHYNVTFPRSIGTCAFVSGVGPGPGQSDAFTLSATSNNVAVFTQDSAGTATDRSFSILVIC